MIMTMANAVINLAVLVFGLSAVYSKKLTNLQVYQIVLMMSIFVDVVLTYLTIVNMLQIIIKCLLLFLSRCLVTSLLTVLIMPLGAA